MNAGSDRKPATILVVDDDAEFLDQLQPALEQYDFRVLTCSDPRRAPGLWSRHRPSAIVLDLEMPVLSGLDLLRRLRGRSLTSETPTVLLTGHDRSAIRLQGFRSGLDDFISKGSPVEELALRLRSVLRRSDPRIRMLTRRDLHPMDLDDRISAGDRSVQVFQWNSVRYMAVSELADRVDELAEVQHLAHHRLRDCLAARGAFGALVALDETSCLHIPAAKLERPFQLLRAARVIRAVRRRMRQMFPATYLAPTERQTLEPIPCPSLRLLDVQLESAVLDGQLFDYLKTRLGMPDEGPVITLRAAF
ncbi:MAG: response regulator transcription factor [Spirochaetales bacterium]|nr:response regulator transcription factor [Leptospiraceae bacterium]MCP5480665.1 response regulator transcription factor [Spirochaetales bacterium]MCP5484017.1 response regulator transcription factor [Spirochaetales bacterium]